MSQSKPLLVADAAVPDRMYERYVLPNNLQVDELTCGKIPADPIRCSSTIRGVDLLLLSWARE